MRFILSITSGNVSLTNIFMYSFSSLLLDYCYLTALNNCFINIYVYILIMLFINC